MRGFISIYLVAAIAFGLVVTAAGVQTARLESKTEELGIEKAAKASAMAAVGRLAAQNQAAEDALAARDKVADEIRKLRAHQRTALREVAKRDPIAKEWLDVPVPAGIIRLWFDGGSSSRSSAGNATGKPDQGNTPSTGRVDNKRKPGTRPAGLPGKP